MSTRAVSESAMNQASFSSSANMPMVIAFRRSGRSRVATATPSAAQSSRIVSSFGSSLSGNGLLLKGVAHLGDDRAGPLLGLIVSQAPGGDDEVEVTVPARVLSGPEGRAARPAGDPDRVDRGVGDGGDHGLRIPAAGRFADQLLLLGPAVQGEQPLVDPGGGVLGDRVGTLAPSSVVVLVHRAHQDPGQRHVVVLPPGASGRSVEFGANDLGHVLG